MNWSELGQPIARYRELMLHILALLLGANMATQRNKSALLLINAIRDWVA